ncbi:Glycosyltransferase [Melia azedarach]|uniref:Glycosyltransferase n=1 Tax=Melia azedarach TaxID=155640 RepID=A0ACC1Z168_MELAZ|nr:Glycosyltransferase [Melia azedarach]
MKMAIESGEIHVVMFPWFGFGHISPFVQLSNKLTLQGVKVSFFSVPGNISRIRSTLKLTPTAEIIPLQIPHIEGLPPGIDSTSEMTPSMAELLKQAMDLMQPQIKTILSELNPHFVIYDFAQPWMPKLASPLGIKTLFFSVFSAVSDAYIMVPVRKNDHTIEDLLKPPNGFPVSSTISLKEFEARDFLYVFMRFNDSPSGYERVIEGRNGCTAIIFKTCMEMESPYIDYNRSQFQKPVLLTGPLIPKPLSGDLEDRWAKWLGQFPAKSVIYCAFGSETYLNSHQIKELALGLELSGLPFFLVLNFPANLDAQNELANALPEGFSERVRNRGVVHTGWVQQRLIFGHDSVGCFLSHSGLSSVIEAMIDDCQLVLLPLKGDQFLNSKLVANDMKAGVQVKRREDDGHFRKEDILKAINAVMVEVNKEPGISIRANQKKWRDFLLNDEIQNKYIAEFVKELKTLA